MKIEKIESSIFNTLTLHEKVERNRIKNLKSASIDLVPIEDKKKLDKYIKQFTSEGYAITYGLAELKNYGRVKQIPYTGLGTFSKPVKGYLANGIYEDIDMVNCHPTILFYLFKSYGLDTSIISEYVNNREEFLKDENISKEDFLTMINKEDYNCSGKIKKLHSQIYGTFLIKIKSDNPKIKPSKDYNPNGQIVANFLQDIEFKLLTELYIFGIDNGILIDCLMHDGFYIRITDKINRIIIENTYLELFSKLIKDKFDLDIKFKIKEHDKSLIGKLETVNGLQTYKDMKNEFEKEHCKIYDDKLFVREKDNKLVFFSSNGISDSCEHLMCIYNDEDGKSEKKSFINLWKKDPEIRIYKSIGCFPNEKDCPIDIFNTWRKFDMELIKEWKNKEKELSIVLNHIKILCGNENKVYDYFCSWIGQLIAFPEVKSICPTFISSQGAGKGTLIYLLKKMLGSKRVLESTNPSRDIWGGFNGQMADVFIVNLNELSKKDTFDAEGKIKGMITDSELIINNKGTNSYSINSHHRFIISTNNHEPINTSKDDRRNLIIRCSDEKCGDRKYFDEIYSLLNDQNVIKTCYEYFKSLPNLKTFNNLPIPSTEHQEILKDANVHPIELWIKDIVIESNKTGEKKIEMTSTQIYNSFEKFKLNNGIKIELNSIQITTKLGIMKVSGVNNIVRKNIRIKQFDTVKIKEFYGMD